MNSTAGRAAADRHGLVVLLMVFLGMLGGQFTLDRLDEGLPAWDLRVPGVLGIVTIFFLWRAAEGGAHRDWRIVEPGLLLLAAWAGWMACSVVWAPPKARAEGYVLDLVLLIVLVAVASSIAGRLSRRALHAVWAWFVLAGLVYFVAAFVAGPGVQGRYSALGGGPNVFVRIMVLACLGAFFLASVRGSRWVLWTTPVFLAGAVLSGSRGGLVAAVAVVVLCGIPLARSMTRRGRRAAVAAGLAATSIAAFVVGPEVVQQFESRFLVQTFQQQYDAHRGEIARSAWQLFEAHPLVGVGLDGYYALVGAGLSLEYPHNLALATAAEGGAVGLSLLALALVAFIWAVMASRPLAVETLYAVAGAAYILVASMFSGDYYDSRFLWFFLALAAVEARRTDGASAGSPRDAPIR